jgi:hypothetical protein
MANKRQYKTLTKAQTTKVRSLTKKGKTQGQIAKALGVSKQRVSTAQAKAGVGKRRPSPFWSQVKRIKTEGEITHKEATKIVYNFPKWGKKRHGKGFLTPDERYAAMRAKRKEFDYEGKLSYKDQKDIDEYGEDIGLGDTPK